MQQYYFKTEETKEKHRIGSLKGNETIRKKHREKYKLNYKICKNCFEEIPYGKRNNIFCSSSCSAIFNNKKRKKEKVCKKCNKILKTNHHKSVYCSNKCHSTLRYKNYIEKWKKGGETGMRGEQISNHIRRYLFEKYNNKCSNLGCGWGEINSYSKRIPLEVEHIDGNYLNNKEENLTLLCPNCHSLTKTAKGANRGNGRYYRRLRYKKEHEILNSPL
jgi:hypothetical protein